MSLILPDRFRQQPQYAAPLNSDWKDKLKFISVTGLPGAQDLVSKQVPASSALRRATLKGMASYTASGTSGLVWSSLTPVANTGSGLAFLVFANPSDSATQQRTLFLGDEAASAYNQCDFAFNMSASGSDQAGVFSVVDYNSGFLAVAQSDWGQFDGNWHVFIANRPAGSSAWSLYRDGVNVTSYSAAGAGLALTAGVRVHCAPTTTSGYTGNIALAAVLNTLNSQQIAALSENPWQLFKAPSRRLWAPTAPPPTGSTNFRSTLSALGTRSGSRQAHR